MITGTVSALNTDRSIPPGAVRRGLEYLARTDLAALAAGRYEIEGDRMFVLVLEYSTLPWAEVKPEAHDRFIDIQCVITGREFHGVTPRRPGLEVIEDQREANDILFFKDPADESTVVLSAGMYAVYFPHDVHRPGCTQAAPEKVKKAVVKVAVDLP